MLHVLIRSLAASVLGIYAMSSFTARCCGCCSLSSLLFRYVEAVGPRFLRKALMDGFVPFPAGRCKVFLGRGVRIGRSAVMMEKAGFEGSNLC